MRTILCLLLLLAANRLTADEAPSSRAPRNLLIITCHPDDWEIGMAGTAYLLKDKFRIHVAIASDGELGNTWNTTGKPDPELGLERVKDSGKSAEKIHATNHFFRMPDGGVYADETAVQKMMALVKVLDPAVVFLHWPIDKPDHAAASTLALMALSKAGMTFNREIYYFEVGKLDHFIPQIYVDITTVWDVKRDLVQIHERFHDDRFRKMAEESALHHGRSSHGKYAEGFIPLLPFSSGPATRKIGCALMDL